VPKVLVTGASGFIGRALTKALVGQSDEVIGLGSRDGDIAEPDTLKPYAGVDFYRVFHLAARTFVPDSWKDPLAFYRTNVLGTANVLEFCRARGVPLTFVSAYIYGQPEKLPIGEDSPIRPNNPYAQSKYLAEQLCQFFVEEFYSRITIVRPFNVYGKGQALKFLIPSIIEQAERAPVIKVKDLAPKRDSIYIDDLVRALILALPREKEMAIYNIGSGLSVSVRETIETVQAVLGTHKAVVEEREARKNEIQDVRADISRAVNKLDWSPHYSLYDGIKEMVSTHG
jgi:GDP-4-dehydro-6-deoxy-D-mannose reductase